MTAEKKYATAPWDNMRLSDKESKCAVWFQELQSRLTTAFTDLERAYSDSPDDDAAFIFTPWNYKGEGGGVSGLMRGRVFEKVGVNVSVIRGTFSEEFATKIPGALENDGAFFAAGLSIVAHMRNPHVPAAHMNTRFISTSKHWFGGGGDLNPPLPIDEDTEAFHAAFRQTCDAHDPAYYPKFKAWCDEYFYMPHRGEHRGVGGIFYDYVDSGDFENDFRFTRDVGTTFQRIYTDLIAKRALQPWSEAERETQLHKRGRYAEFNLLYDRGTKFGLQTGGNTESILMSLPPAARW